MIKVYLDNNIIVDIEDGKILVDLFLNRGDCAYYFSQAHIEELLEAKGNPKVSQKGRLNLLSKLCGKNHILTGVVDIPEFVDKEPIEMYNLLCNTYSLRQPINQAVNQFDLFASRIQQELGFDTIQFNNEPPEDVLRLIDNRMNERLYIDLITYLNETEACKGKSLYNTLLQLIDMANYWGDKKTNRSNIARRYDASHAYFAQLCDILVTNDRRMSMKVQAIYSFLGVKTRVISADNFLQN
jgi:hypothetical protein